MSYKILDKDNSNYQCANLKMYILASPPAPLMKERGVASALCHRCWLVEISPLAFRGCVKIKYFKFFDIFGFMLLKKEMLSFD